MNNNSHLKDAQQFELFFNIHPAALSIARIRDGKIVEVNQGYLELIGYKREEIIGKTTLEYNVWDKPADREKLLNMLLTKKQFKNFETVLIHKNGSKLNVTLTASLIVIENEPHAVSITHDITKRKLIEEKLIESTRLLKETQQMAGLGTYVIDFVNNTWTSSEILDRIFGIDESFERKIENWLKIVHPDWSEEMWDYLQNEVISQKKRFNKEYKIVRINDGSERWVDGKGELEFNESGTPIRMLGTITDITYRKSIELELANERKLLDNILETSPVGIIVVEKNGGISYANKTGVETLGLSKSDIKQLTYNSPNWVITDWEGNPYPDDQLPFMLVKSTLKPCYKVQHAIEYNNGKRTMLSINAAPLFDENKKFNGMIATIEDITDRKISEIKIHRQNTELAQLNASKDKFFSIISHDLKGPLGALKSLCNILVERFYTYSQDESFHLIQKLENVATQTYSLTENLLEWSRLQRKITKAQIENCNIQNLVSDIILLFNEMAQKKSILIENNISGHPTASCDVNMTKTILRNLISNAIKFTKKNGKVFVECIKKGSELEIRVIDSGEGIASENLANIFDIANNSVTPGTSGEKGTGIGLPLCKDLIKMQGGQINVISEVGKGSEFYFTLNSV